MKGIAKSRAEVIKTTAMYNSGEWFTTRELEADMGMDYHKIMGAMTYLRKEGLADSRKLPGMDAMQWRKRQQVVNLLRFSWDRKSLCEVLGVA